MRLKRYGANSVHASRPKTSRKTSVAILRSRDRRRKNSFWSEVTALWPKDLRETTLDSSTFKSFSSRFPVRDNSKPYSRDDFFHFIRDDGKIRVSLGLKDLNCLKEKDLEAFLKYKLYILNLSKLSEDSSLRLFLRNLSWLKNRSREGVDHLRNPKLLSKYDVLEEGFFEQNPYKIFNLERKRSLMAKSLDSLRLLEARLADLLVVSERCRDVFLQFYRLKRNFTDLNKREAMDLLTPPRFRKGPRRDTKLESFEEVLIILGNDLPRGSYPFLVSKARNMVLLYKGYQRLYSSDMESLGKGLKEIRDSFKDDRMLRLKDFNDILNSQVILKPSRSYSQDPSRFYSDLLSLHCRVSTILEDLESIRKDF